MLRVCVQADRVPKPWARSVASLCRRFSAFLLWKFSYGMSNMFDAVQGAVNDQLMRTYAYFGPKNMAPTTGISSWMTAQ